MKFDNFIFLNIQTIDIPFIVIITFFQSISLSAFFRCFMPNSSVHTEFQTEPLFLTTGVDCSNSVNHDRVQVLSYGKRSFLVLPVVGIEPVSSCWFRSEATSNQISYIYPRHTIQSKF